MYPVFIVTAFCGNLSNVSSFMILSHYRNLHCNIS